MPIPEWASKVGEDSYEIRVDEAYPAILRELADSASDLPEPQKGVSELPWMAELRNLDPDQPDQYWIEVAYQCAKLDLRRGLLLEGKSAWPDRIFMRGTKEKWGLKHHPRGRGTEAATQGKEAREHYRRLRGFIPN